MSAFAAVKAGIQCPPFYLCNPGHRRRRVALVVVASALGGVEWCCVGLRGGRGWDSMSPLLPLQPDNGLPIIAYRGRRRRCVVVGVGLALATV